MDCAIEDLVFVEVYHDKKRMFLPLLKGKAFPIQLQMHKNILNPFSLKYLELKELCEINRIALHEIIDNRAEDDYVQDLSKILVTDALDGFFRNLKSSHTEKAYRNAFVNLKKIGLKEDMTIAEFSNSSQHKLLLSLDGTSVECAALNSFLKYLDGKKRNFPSRCKAYFPKKLKDQPLTNQELRCFLKHLYSISPVADLIARIIWKINKVLNHPLALRTSHSFISFESILRLQADDIQHEKRMINIFRQYQGKQIAVFIQLPPYIFNRLQKLSEVHSKFIFRQKLGAPLRPQQISKVFRGAGEKAGIKDMSSLRLRPNIYRNT